MTKEQILQCVEKAKKISELQKEITSEIPTCWGNYSWHIYNFDNFKQVCDILGIKYTGRGWKGAIHYEAEYEGITIVSVYSIPDEVIMGVAGI